MKTLGWQILFKNLIIVGVVFLVTAIFVSFVIEKKLETSIASNLEYIRDSKYKSIDSQNLSTAFDFSSLTYTTYIIDENGAPILGGSFTVDNQVKNFCKQAVSGTQSYEKEGSTKYVSWKQNGTLCLVAESNTNSTIMLGSFVRSMLLYMVVGLLALLFILLRFTKIKIERPIKQISDNAQISLLGKFNDIKKVNTNIKEMQDLDKFFGYIIDLMKQKVNAGIVSTTLETKNVEANFVKEKALLEANKFKQALDSAEQIIAILDKNLYLNYLNKFTSTYTGFPIAQAENKKITELWHNVGETNLWEEKHSLLLTSKKTVSFKPVGKKNNGASYESEVLLSPILGGTGEVEYILLIERDVSEEKQKERVKNEFVSVVSHELRTPMTVIRGYSTLLAEGKLGELNPKQKEYVEKINEETTRLLEMANDMLDIQKFDAGKAELHLEKTDLEMYLKDEIKEFTPLYVKKNLYLRVENQATAKTAEIDKRYMHRAISNLLSNALKFTEEGGVTIYIINPDEENVVIAVRDTGIGINESALTHLFDKFYQASNVLNRKQDGSGLGLSIVKRVTEAHKGLVWVESKEKEGTTFYIALSQAHDGVTPSTPKIDVKEEMKEELKK